MLLCEQFEKQTFETVDEHRVEAKLSATAAQEDVRFVALFQQ